ncbi:MAG: protein-tyrosine phosphatase [Solirubrobacteraceae bacterium]|nr:protein-tyrosine phosphatase [Solirubrobacteraceae bacterium]
MAAGTTDERWVDLEGAVNVRDLGGLELAGGGRTAPGVLLRSDNLQGLTGRDVGRLVDEHGVRVVVDLRTRTEVEREGPGPLVSDARVDIRHRSLFPEAGNLTDVAADGLLPWQGRPLGGDPADSAAVRAYLGYLRDRPDSIVAALRDVVEAGGAAVVHCAAGKDRTGVVCALALAAVGVPRETIVADYVATADRLEALLGRLRASPTYPDDLDGRPDATHRPRPETMTRVLDVLDERHGGAGGWLAAHGFGDDEQAALRRRLVA